MTSTSSESNMETWEELEKATAQLDGLLKMLRTLGTTKAETERDYKMAISKKVLEMKDQKIPSTIINLTIYGQPEIARLRFERDVAEVNYNACQEAININKLKVKILSAQMEREYYHE